MRVLVTNDDGYMALGIRTLTRVAERLGTVRVVAPDREQSATSHSLTMRFPLRARRTEGGALAVDGTPTDCVVLAVGALLDERPDLVLSGVNHGANMGEDVLYSGTVAAAMEATLLGIPAVAISYAGRDPEAITGWADPLTELLGQIAARGEFPKETLFNINLPPIPPEQVNGVRITTLGRRAYMESLTRAHDPSGNEYFWIGGGEIRWWGGPDSDFQAIHEGAISVTPLHLDLTNYRLLEEIGRWELKL